MTGLVVGEADSFAALRNDSQKCKCNSKGAASMDLEDFASHPSAKSAYGWGTRNSAEASYISSSMKDLAVAAGMRLGWWTSGPGFRTGSSSVRVGTSVRS